MSFLTPVKCCTPGKCAFLVLVGITTLLLGCGPSTVPTAVPARMPALTATGLPGSLKATPTPSPPTQTPTAVATAQPTTFSTAAPTQPVITPTATRSQPTTAPAPTTPVPGFELAALQDVMLAAINADRAAAGLTPVAWDATAAQAGQAHAADMLAHNYFSHWNLQGLGPEHRYALAGGRDAVAENLYTFWYRYEDGRAAPIEDWPRVIRDAQASLMQSPGHRRTILDPAHTHVGIGIAYDPQRGEMRLAQEFVSRLVDMEVLPMEAASGDTVQVRGTLGTDVRDPLINLAYQPLPTPFTAETVPNGTYSSRAEIIEAIGPQVDGNQFSANVRLGEIDTPGIYSIRVWVKQGEDMVPASELIVFAKS